VRTGNPLRSVARTRPARSRGRHVAGAALKPCLEPITTTCISFWKCVRSLSRQSFKGLRKHRLSRFPVCAARCAAPAIRYLRGAGCIQKCPGPQQPSGDDFDYPPVEKNIALYSSFGSFRCAGISYTPLVPTRLSRAIVPPCVHAESPEEIQKDQTQTG
jgi:hypothetical protein